MDEDETLEWLIGFLVKNTSYKLDDLFALSEQQLYTLFSCVNITIRADYGLGTPAQEAKREECKKESLKQLEEQSFNRLQKVQQGKPLSLIELFKQMKA